MPPTPLSPWKILLTYCSGSIEPELLRKYEYVLEENRVYREQLHGRPRFSDEQRRSLAQKAKALRRKVLDEAATIAKPETLLKWHRRLVARKFDGSANRRGAGRPPIDPEVETLVLDMARDNPAWGYDRIADAVRNLGHRISDQCVGNILRRHGLPPSGERRRNSTWHDFIARHKDVLWATDFFSQVAYRRNEERHRWPHRQVSEQVARRETSEAHAPRKCGRPPG